MNLDVIGTSTTGNYCPRCGGHWWGTHACPGPTFQPGGTIPAPIYPVPTFVPPPAPTVAPAPPSYWCQGCQRVVPAGHCEAGQLDRLDDIVRRLARIEDRLPAMQEDPTTE